MFTHQYGCNSLEQSSGAAEDCGDIEAPLSFNCLKVYSSPLNKHFVLLAQFFASLFRCLFLKKIEQVQGEGAGSDSERQRRLDEQIDSEIKLLSHFVLYKPVYFLSHSIVVRIAFYHFVKPSWIWPYCLRCFRSSTQREDFPWATVWADVSHGLSGCGAR